MLINILSTDWGDVRIPNDMAAMWPQLRIRKDGQPDRRSTAGKKWWARFAQVTHNVRVLYESRH